MKRALLSFAAAALLLLALVAGPALSVRPYRPKPVDFELAGVQAKAGAALSSGRVRSPAVHAPKRFNLVGMRWRGETEPTIRLRARKSGGRWSRWVPVKAHSEDSPDLGRGERRPGVGFSAPVWVGQADYVQYRLSRPLPGLRLHFVNSTGTATAKERALSAVRKFVNRGVVAVARGPSSAVAQSRPSMVSREGWGAEDCPPRRGPGYGAVKASLVHHTVNANDYTRDEAPGIVLAICRFHRNSNGWDDIGYNFLVDKYGTIYEGRAGGVDRAVIGAHAQGFNSETTGIANLGTFSDSPQTEAGLRAMARLIRWKLPLHGQPTTGRASLTSAGGSSSRYPRGQQVKIDRISGHRDTGQTACPGNVLYGQLGDLRRMVGEVQPAGNETSLELSARPTIVRYGRRTKLRGLLTRSDGTRVAGAPVQLQLFGRRGWRDYKTATTNSAGRYSLKIKPRGKRVVRASFAGDGVLLPSTSGQPVVQVRPVMPAQGPPPIVATGDRVVLDAKIAPEKRRVSVIFEVRSRGRNRRVATISTRPRDGDFRRVFRPRKTGYYRLYARFGGDRANLRARTRIFQVQVVRANAP